MDFVILIQIPNNIYVCSNNYILKIIFLGALNYSQQTCGIGDVVTGLLYENLDRKGQFRETEKQREL